MYTKESDNMLDVYALFQSKIQKLAEDSIQISQQLQNQSETLTQIRAVNDTLWDMLADLGVPADQIESTRVQSEVPSPLPVEKIPLPQDMDYHEAFQDLVEEAHSKGFVNTLVEQILSDEEIERAIKRSSLLDQQFSEATAMEPIDTFVIMIGAAIHVLRYILNIAVRQNPVVQSGADEELGAGEEGPERQFPFPNIKDNVDKAAEILRTIPFKREIIIKSPERILMDAPSFRMVVDSRFPRQEDFLGNHPIWGWIAGTFNIITDTVTVRDLHTFQPDLTESNSYYKLSQKYLPFMDLFLPFIDHGMHGLLDNIIAATIREAYILIPNQIQFQDYSQCFLNSKRLHSTVMSSAQTISGILSFDRFNDALMNAGWASLINTIIIALYGLLYEGDCGQSQHLVRMMKVVTAANLIGSALGSLPALAMENWANLDYAGILSSILNTASLMKLMIDVKEEFLASEYLATLNEQIHSLDRYFDQY